MGTPSSTSASKAKVVAPEKPSNLFRRLSAVLLINAAEFAKATPAQQTKTTASAEGLPIEFVADFFDLGNKRVIRDKLLSGKDISRELEFNDVTLDAEELRAFALIKPVLAKIEAIGPNYPWLPAQDHAKNITCGTNRVQRNGHFVGKATAKRIWDKAAPFWAGGPQPKSNEVPTNGANYNNRTASYGRDGVTVGCQTISRSEIEFIARHYGWDPIVTA